MLDSDLVAGPAFDATVNTHLRNAPVFHVPYNWRTPYYPAFGQNRADNEMWCLDSQHTLITEPVLYVMTCDICKTPHPTEELVNGKCVRCLHTENTTLRLLLAHVIMAIENGTKDQENNTYVQAFSCTFLDHLKITLGVLNSANTES